MRLLFTYPTVCGRKELRRLRCNSGASNPSVFSRSNGPKDLEQIVVVVCPQPQTRRTGNRLLLLRQDFLVEEIRVACDEHPVGYRDALVRIRCVENGYCGITEGVSELLRHGVERRNEFDV